MYYILMTFMNTVRNRTQITQKTKDFAQTYSPAVLVIPPKVEKARC